MQRDCPIVITGCPGVDSPVTNTSSEAPDPLLWAGIGWSPYNTHAVPTLGGGPVTEPQDYSNVTYSQTSQQMADMMAGVYATLGIEPPPPPSPDPPGTWPDPPPFPDDEAFPPFPPLPDYVMPTFVWKPPGWEVPPGDDYQQFSNTRQVATAACPNGSVFTLAVEAGTIVSGLIPPALGPAWVAMADAWALAWAQQSVYALRICVEVDNLALRVPPGPNPPDWWPSDDPNYPWPPPSPTTTPSTLIPPRGTTLALNPTWICNGSVVDPLYFQYSVSGQGNAEFLFSIVAGSVPPGTSLVQVNKRKCELDGTPTVPGVYAYTVRATRSDAANMYTDITDTVYVPGITNTTLPAATVDTPYIAQLLADGGVAPYTFTLVGTLPAGLTMTSAGYISGTPTVNGSFSFDVNLTDADGALCTQTINLSIPASIGPDWDSIVWTEITLWNDMTPNFLGAQFAMVGNTPDPQGVDSADLQYVGQVTYNGPEAHCKLHLSCAATIVPYGEPIDPPYSGMRLDITNSEATLSELHSIYEPAGIGENTSGTYDFYFTVPDTGGLDSVITINVYANAGMSTWGGGSCVQCGSGTVNGSGIFTNL